jgi:uncharacterized membrane protein YciS (DUF1049 family)
MNNLFSYLLTNANIAANSSSEYSTALIALFVVGFILATTIGSIAWYNSKRPMGWEDKERPDFVQEVDK